MQEMNELKVLNFEINGSNNKDNKNDNKNKKEDLKKSINFSMGEKQLFCLAKAIVRECKINQIIHNLNRLNNNNLNSDKKKIII